MAAKFQLYPYQASYNNWIQIWDAWYVAGAGVPTTNPGFVGTLNPNLLTVGVATSFAKSLGWPTYLPFNQSRTLYLSSSDDNWGAAGSLLTLTYQNYWGFYIQTIPVSDPDTGVWTPSDGVLIGDALYNIGSPSDTTFKSCPKFYYPNRLIDISFLTSGTLPTAPLYIDFGNKGMAEFQIQDSVRYGNSNFALEILTDNPGGPPPTAYTTQYTVLGSNYPRFVFDNNQYANPMGPLTLSDFFINFENNPWPNLYNETTTPQTAISWLASEDFVINGPLNENSFNNLPFDGGLLNALVDIGNQRRNEGYTTEDPGPDNNANLLLSLIQNGITN